MANNFPSAACTIRRLTKMGYEAIPSFHWGGRPGLYVANGLAHTFGPTITVRGYPVPGDNAKVATDVRNSLAAAGWHVEDPKHGQDAVIRVVSIPR